MGVAQLKEAIARSDRRKFFSEKKLLFLVGVFGAMHPNPPAVFGQKNFSRFSQLATLSAACWILNGCVVAERRPRHEPVIQAPPPPERVVVREGPGASVVIIKEAPPPPRREVIVERERPSPRHVWVAGYWSWEGRSHVWIPGHWELPPHPHAVWVEPRWERRGEGYVFIQGVWR